MVWNTTDLVDLQIGCDWAVQWNPCWIWPHERALLPFSGCTFTKTTLYNIFCTAQSKCYNPRTNSLPCTCTQHMHTHAYTHPSLHTFKTIKTPWLISWLIFSWGVPLYCLPDLFVGGLIYGVWTCAFAWQNSHSVCDEMCKTWTFDLKQACYTD